MFPTEIRLEKNIRIVIASSRRGSSNKEASDGIVKKYKNELSHNGRALPSFFFFDGHFMQEISRKNMI